MPISVGDGTIGNGVVNKDKAGPTMFHINVLGATSLSGEAFKCFLLLLFDSVIQSVASAHGP